MGKALLALTVLVAAAAGGGYYNYERNAHLDEELAGRPYATLADAELDLLIAAYEQERAELEERLAVIASRAGGGRGYGDDLMGKVKGFDRAQRHATQWRDAQAEMLDRQVAVESLEREKQIRTRGLDSEWQRVWRRVTTL